MDSVAIGYRREGNMMMWGLVLTINIRGDNCEFDAGCCIYADYLWFLCLIDHWIYTCIYIGGWSYKWNTFHDMTLIIQP